ncbi:MAG: DUF6398 domain-containing protein [Actinomycetota bacterium]|nr:DUF6398 domain-containing protein [Actinomycetota bacterium]
MLTMIRRSLSDRDPLEFLLLASSLLAALDPRRRDPLERIQGAPAEQLSASEFCDTFIHTNLPEASAMLVAFAQMGDDELLRARAQRELARRSHALPAWLRHLDNVRVSRASIMSHVLGDGDNVVVEVTLTSGQPFSLVIYIDHNMGTVVKDGFAVPLSIDELSFEMTARMDDPDTVMSDLSVADARQHIAEAIDAGAMIYPPLETDSWPSCRPLTEWIVRLLPLGGTGYVRPQWDDRAIASLTRQFFASPYGADVASAEHRDMLDSILWFARDYGPGDPLRWSSVAVEILLVDWIPRKIIAPVDYLALAPQVLRAFVRFAHAQRGIRQSLTTETLEAIDRYEPMFSRLIDLPRLTGPAAVLGASGLLDGDDFEAILSHPSYAQWALGWMSDAVGGTDALYSLDEAPLEDREFSWFDIPDDIHDKVAEVLNLCDQFCDERLDVEYRSACRLLLEQVAVGDPQVFRRKARTDTAAAAICWTVGKVNDLFTSNGMYVKDMMQYFGIVQGSVSQRAETMLRAAGYGTRSGFMNFDLGNLDLLVSSRRRRIIDLRDRMLELDSTP